jgi:hypothetical protein
MITGLIYEAEGRPSKRFFEAGFNLFHPGPTHPRISLKVSAKSTLDHKKDQLRKF